MWPNRETNNQRAIEAKEMKKNANWIIGDCARLELEMMANTPKDEALAAWAAEVGIGENMEILKQMVRVSEAFQGDVRDFDLTWSHYREVASLEPKKALTSLEEAADNGWSVSQLARSIKKQSVIKEKHKCPDCDAVHIKGEKHGSN
jgi:hypothetical protein